MLFLASLITSLIEQLALAKAVDVDIEMDSAPTSSSSVKKKAARAPRKKVCLSSLSDIRANKSLSQETVKRPEVVCIPYAAVPCLDFSSPAYVLAKKTLAKAALNADKSRKGSEVVDLTASPRKRQRSDSHAFADSEFLLAGSSPVLHYFLRWY